MTKNIKIVVPGDPNPLEKSIEYFNAYGYKIISRKEDIVRLKQGSSISNAWTFDALKWMCESEIKWIGQTVIEANLNINTSGQIVTLKEEQLWDTFIDNYKRFLTETQYNFIAANSKALHSVRKNSIKYVSWAALGGLIAFIPAAIIAYFTGIDVIAPMGAVIGAVGFLMKKIQDEKKLPG